MSKSKPNIVAELRKAIKSAERGGMTKYQISKATGMPQSQVGRIASGKSIPRLDNAACIAAGVGYRLVLVPMVAK